MPESEESEEADEDLPGSSDRTTKAALNEFAQASIPLDRMYPIRQKEYFDKYMVGQNHLKEELAIQVYHHLCLKESQEAMLLVGDTGSGKNHSIEVLRRWFREMKIRVPVVVFDASRITPNGFTGDSSSDVVKEIRAAMRSFGSDIAIVYLDEICKIIQPNYDSQGEDVNRIVQGQLLTMISGDPIGGLNMKKVLFILGGAFDTVQENRKKRREARPVGFGENYSVKRASDGPTIREELIAAGMTREFLGRIATIVELDTPDRTMLKSILTHPKVGAIAKKKRLYEIDDLELSIADEVVEEIVDEALKQNLGARSATNKITEVLGTYNYKMLSHGYSKIYIHAGVLHGEEPYYEKTKITEKKTGDRNNRSQDGEYTGSGRKTRAAG